MAHQNSNTLNIFFALLRSGLYGKPLSAAQLPDAIDWERIMAIAQKQSVFGTIIESVQYLPEELRPQGKVAARMSKFALGLIQANAVFDKTAASLASFLDRHGIPGVLLKGQGVARYYRQPQMRQNGDIDYYVGEKLYKRAVTLCIEHLQDDGSESDSTPQHFSFFLNGVPIELHRVAAQVYTPGKRGRFRRWVEQQLEQSSARRTLSIGSATVALPSYDFDAIFIFYHAWHHFITGGIGLRQLCDWAMIFHSRSEEIDSDRLINNLRSFGMTRGWQLFACIAVNHLGVAPEKMPLYNPVYDKKAEKILAEIIDGGNFGFYSKAYRRLPSETEGWRYPLIKLGNVTQYYFDLFPLIPIEATFLFFNRLFAGALTRTNMSNHHKD